MPIPIPPSTAVCHYYGPPMWYSYGPPMPIPTYAYGHCARPPWGSARKGHGVARGRPVGAAPEAHQVIAGEALRARAGTCVCAPAFRAGTRRTEINSGPGRVTGPAGSAGVTRCAVPDDDRMLPCGRPGWPLAAEHGMAGRPGPGRGSRGAAAI